MGLYQHRAVNHLNVLHIISWCLLSLGAEPRWDECHYSGEALAVMLLLFAVEMRLGSAETERAVSTATDTALLT